ncbi:MAG: ATP-binding protein [Solirubrobacterales bacterium]
MDRGTRSVKSPSIRGLVRQGLAVQVTLALLILLAVMLAFVLRLDLISEQERGTRAIGDLRSATVDLLGTVESIDKYARLSRAEDLKNFQASFAQLQKDVQASARWLDGSDKKRVEAAAASTIDWKASVLQAVIDDVRAGDPSAAQARLLSTRNDREIAEVGLAISVTMDEVVKRQLRAEKSSRTLLFATGGVIIAALFALIAGAIVFLLPLRKRVVEPLEDIARASKSIGDGDFSARVERRGVHETELAAAAFNQMADIVEHHIDEYEHLDDLKNQFIAAASHELRTPITSIRGYVEMHLDGEVGDISETQRKNLEVVQRNALQLGELIDDLLTLSSVNQQGRVALVTERCDLTEILKEATSELRPLAVESRIELDKRCEGDLTINADRARIRRVFLNIVSNAIKFSAPGARVVIRATREEDFVAVSVADTGIGIAEEDLPRIGQRFFRAQSARDTYGTGLGLSIAGELIEMHGGRLEIHSRVGEGSTFTVLLPVAGPPPPSPELLNGDSAEALPSTFVGDESAQTGPTTQS